MGDIIDDGNATAEFLLANELRKQKQNATTATPMGIGMCINSACGEEIDGDGRWCSTECRDQWQADQARKGRS